MTEKHLEGKDPLAEISGSAHAGIADIKVHGPTYEETIERNQQTTSCLFLIEIHCYTRLHNNIKA